MARTPAFPLNRREQLFLLWAVSATVLLILGVGALVILALPRSPTRITLGRVEAFSPGSVRLVNLPENFVDPEAISIAAPKVWVVRHEDGAFVALYARTSVHGNPVQWEPESKHLTDAQLGNKWDRDVRYLEGPDQRDLDRFPVTVENGQVVIDLHLVIGVAPTPTK